eukprot:1148634-Pelagomonas_calceolata.AAC.1
MVACRCEWLHAVTGGAQEVSTEQSAQKVFVEQTLEQEGLNRWRPGSLDRAEAQAGSNGWHPGSLAEVDAPAERSTGAGLHVQMQIASANRWIHCRALVCMTMQSNCAVQGRPCSYCAMPVDETSLKNSLNACG